MTCWSKEELENMLEDVINELDLSDEALGRYGPDGTPVAVAVREVLAEKDKRISMLKAGFVDAGIGRMKHIPESCDVIGMRTDNRDEEIKALKVRKAELEMEFERGKEFGLSRSSEEERAAGLREALDRGFVVTQVDYSIMRGKYEARVKELERNSELFLTSLASHCWRYNHGAERADGVLDDISSEVKEAMGALKVQS